MDFFYRVSRPRKRVVVPATVTTLATAAVAADDDEVAAAQIFLVSEGDRVFKAHQGAPSHVRALSASRMEMLCAHNVQIIMKGPLLSSSYGGGGFFLLGEQHNKGGQSRGSKPYSSTPWFVHEPEDGGGLKWRLHWRRQRKRLPDLTSHARDPKCWLIRTDSY